MTSKLIVRWGAGFAAVALLAACSNSASTPTSTPPSASATGSVAPSGDPLGVPNKATGTPITVGLLNLENGPVTFPMVRQGIEAAIAYVNDYKGGLGGHPIKLVHCETDSQPATSQRCANQILDQKPAFILGGADTGSAGAYPVWQRADLAVVGGVSFTPVEQNYAKGFEFGAVAGPDNAAAVVYAHQQGAKSGVSVYTSDTQGTRVGDGVEKFMKNVGMSPVSGVPIPPTAADVSPQAATVVSSSPDIVFTTTPVGCASLLKSLNQLGFKGKVYVIDPCTDPKVIAAGGAGANNITWGSPVDLPGSTPDSKLYMAILAKYAPSTPPISLTILGMQGVMNSQTYLSPIADSLTTDAIVAAFTKGTDNPNFAAHAFTCDGKQIPGSISVCNGYQRILNYADGKTTALGDWVNPSPAMGG
jgi:branched-chain amino acid transport system substrate-binding protein